MRILILTQPWATLVAIGVKKIETRSWSTSYRGPIAIHAAAGLGPVGGEKGLIELCQSDLFRRQLFPDWDDDDWSDLFAEDALGLPRGAIVAVATLRECLRIGGLFYGEFCPPDPEEPEFHFGDYTPGRYAWLLSDVRPLRTPLPYRGAQGLRPLPAEVVAQIEGLL